jgi:hypothetical protein
VLKRNFKASTISKLLKVEYLYWWQQRAADIFEGGGDREARSAEDKKGESNEPENPILSYS